MSETSWIKLLAFGLDVVVLVGVVVAITCYGVNKLIGFFKGR